MDLTFSGADQRRHREGGRKRTFSGRSFSVRWSIRIALGLFGNFVVFLRAERKRVICFKVPELLAQLSLNGADNVYYREEDTIFLSLADG